jgi:hypothetical protein
LANPPKAWRTPFRGDSFCGDVSAHRGGLSSDVPPAAEGFEELDAGGQVVSEITPKGGRVEQANVNNYRALRITSSTPSGRCPPTSCRAARLPVPDRSRSQGDHVAYAGADASQELVAFSDLISRQRTSRALAESLAERVIGSIRRECLTEALARRRVRSRSLWQLLQSAPAEASQRWPSSSKARARRTSISVRGRPM